MAINFNKAEFILSAASAQQFIRDGLPQLAFAGRSNVGKSSVINRLVNRKNFARVGASPGKTSQINYFKIDGRLYLVDLPGYGYAKVSKAERDRWGRLMENYFQSAGLIALGVQIVDARHKPTADGSAHNNLIIEYDIDSRVFNIRSGMNVSKFVVFNNQLLFSGNDGFIYTFDNSIKYNGANITAHYETPYCDFQNKNMLKTLDSVCFTAKGTGSVKISAETERGTVSKTVTLKRSSDFDIYHIPLYNAGRRFKFCFDNVNGSQFEIIRPEFILEKDDED